MTLPAGTQGTTSRNAHLVRFEGVRLGSRRVPLLSEFSLTVHPGQFWALMIAPGPLRKAMMRALLGIGRGHGGTVEWNRSFSASSSVTARIGFVPEACSIPPGLSTTVREFVALGLIGIEGGASEAARIAWALEQLGLVDTERRAAANLSTSERVSMLVARALARRPRFLVVADPTAGLDDPSREALLDRIARLNKNERLAVAWFTADAEVAERYATHVGALVEGTLHITEQIAATPRAAARSRP